MHSHVAMWRVTQVHGVAMDFKHAAYSDTNNCTVRAVADALGLNLITAYEFMKACGRKHGRGLMPYYTRRAYKVIAQHLGYEYVGLCQWDTITQYGRTIRTAQRALLPHERIVFSVRGHVIGFHDRVTSDWADSRLHRIECAHVFKRAA